MWTRGSPCIPRSRSLQFRPKVLFTVSAGLHEIRHLTAKDVRNWFDDLSVTRAGSANRALAVLSSMMKHAEALGLRREDSNPCKGLRRRKTGFEAHYLTDDEFAALGRALDGAEAVHPAAVAVVRFLLYTGARKSEALRLKWEHVHGDRAVLPDSKTGPRTIWLASPARAVLAAHLRRTNCPWVFASPCAGPATVDSEWNAIRVAAGLPTLRIHDLRHSLAAVEGYQLADIFPELRAASSAPGRRKRPLRYRDPQNPDHSWSGVGRTPKWVQAIVDERGIDVAAFKSIPMYRIHASD